MNLRKRTLTTLTCAVFGAALAAPAAFASDIYVVGGTDGFNDKDDLAQWAQLHPDIHVHIIDGGLDKAITMIAGGTPPDLIRIESKDIPGYVHQGLLADIDPYIKSSAAIRADDLVAVNNLYVIDGKRYAINKDWSADLTLFYNKARFADAGIANLSTETPASYDQIMEISHKLTKEENGKIIQWGFGSQAFAYLAYEAMLRAADQPFYSADQLSLALENNTEAIRAADWWIDMARRHWSNFGVADEWGKGNVGINQWGYWFGPISAVGAGATVGDQQAKGGTTEDVGFAPAPTWAGNRMEMAVGTGFALLSASQHKEDAYKVLEWFMTGPPAAKRAKIGWGVPTLKSLFPLVPKGTQLDRDRYNVTLAEAAYIQPQYENPYDEAAFATAWNAHFGDAAQGKISSKDFLAQVDHDVTQALLKAANK